MSDYRRRSIGEREWKRPVALDEGGMAFLTVVMVLLLLTVLGIATMTDRKSTRLNSSHVPLSRMPSYA